MTRSVRLLLIAPVLAMAALAAAQEPASGESTSIPPAAANAVAPAAARAFAWDIREAVLRVPVQVDDAFGRVVSGELPVTTFRPAGPGPFPLVVINHGRDPKTRARYQRQRFESAARFFVRKGFAVAVPLRLGYGELADAGDPEASVDCQRPRYAVAAKALSLQLQAVVRRMAREPDIDADRVVLLGQSMGGFAALAATADGVPGQVAAINFAGGHGGSPDQHPGEPCRVDLLTREFARFGMSESAARVPGLWLYTENDRYFAPRHPRQWAQVYRDGGGQVELRVLPPFDDNGHLLFARGNDQWQPIVDDFLRRLGFDQPGALPYPLPGRVRAGQEGAFPFGSSALREQYRQFLSASAPRAFATNGRNRWGLALGDDAQSRALAMCDGGAQSDEPCHLYAVNDAIVWSQP